MWRPANPAAAVRLPDDPDPWYLDLYKPAPPPAPAPRALGARMAAPMSAGYAADAATPMTAQSSMAKMEEAPVAAEFARTYRADPFQS